jgi:parallel beta-helix repeat protein
LAHYNAIVAGIVGFKSYGTKIIGNVIEGNTALGLDGSETAGIKLHRFVGGLIEGNLIRQNGASGIWLDHVWHDSRVTHNVILSNNGAGLFIELGTALENDTNAKQYQGPYGKLNVKKNLNVFILWPLQNR